MKSTGIMALSFFLTAMPGCDSCDSYSPTIPSTSLATENMNAGSSAEVSALPDRINGVELMTIRGWFANTYPWTYVPEHSGVHPVENLWTPYQAQTPFQITEQDRQLEEYGSGADILEFNVTPGNGDYNHWLTVYLTNSSRPFFVLYEHINGTSNYTNSNGDKNMDLAQNRKAFTDDIGFFFKNVIVPFQSRYVTHNGRAVIYLWASAGMKGDFASLLEEIKNKYPIVFLGSGEIWNSNPKGEDLARVKALDGFMEYTLGGRANYLRTTANYQKASFRWRQVMRRLEAETVKRYVFIPTFQAAYDDTKFPERSSPPMYPRSKEEMEFHAELIRSDFHTTYDGIGPFVVYSELPEGAAVIESQCLPETANRPGRYTGCGTGRLEVLKEYFSK